jgi:hypothetical protein
MATGPLERLILVYLRGHGRAVGRKRAAETLLLAALHVERDQMVVDGHAKELAWGGYRTSGRESEMKPSRFGIRTRGRLRAFIT